MTKLVATISAVLGLCMIFGCGREFPRERDERYVFTAEPVKVLAGTNALAEAAALIGQVITIAGKVTQIKNSSDHAVIQIDASVECGFGSRFHGTLSKLQLGDLVMLKGLVDSVNRTAVYLTPCVFVDGPIQYVFPSERDERYVFTAQPVKELAGTNAATQAQAFIGQVISISGKVTHVGNSGRWPTIEIDDKVTCEFGSRFRKPVAELRLGETVRLKGLLDSVNRVGVYLTPCVFVNGADQ